MGEGTAGRVTSAELNHHDSNFRFEWAVLFSPPSLDAHPLDVSALSVIRSLDMRKKVTQMPRRDERLCPWCETIYPLPSGHPGQICPECRTKLLDESKEFLVDMLGRVTGLNVVLMSSLPVPPGVLEALHLQEKATMRRLSMKAAAAQTDAKK